MCFSFCSSNCRQSEKVFDYQLLYRLIKFVVIFDETFLDILLLLSVLYRAILVYNTELKYHIDYVS